MSRTFNYTTPDDKISIKMDDEFVTITINNDPIRIPICSALRAADELFCEYGPFDGRWQRVEAKTGTGDLKR